LADIRATALRRNTMPSELLEQVATHLSFLSYKVSPVVREGGYENSMSAEHPENQGFEFSEWNGTVKFLCSLRPNKTENFDTTGYLTFINSLNLDAMIVSFCKNKFNLLRAQSIFCGIYDKSSFSFFVKAWERDTSNQFRDKYPEMCKYFS
jgi:hypothetical protein